MATKQYIERACRSILTYCDAACKLVGHPREIFGLEGSLGPPAGLDYAYEAIANSSF